MRNATLMRMARPLVIGGSATAIAVVVAVMADGLIGAGSVLLAIFLGAVTLGFVVAAVVEAVSDERRAASEAGFARRSRRRHGNRCTQCGAPLIQQGTVRLCPACDQAPSQ
jgi:hypothetical protein